MARTLASPCFGHKPKVRATTMMDKIDKNRLIMDIVEILIMDEIIICTLMKMSDNNYMNKINNMKDEIYHMDAINDKFNFIKYFNFIHNVKFYPCV